MKKSLTFTSMIFTGFLLVISCKKDIMVTRPSNINCPYINKAPVANAGTDQNLSFQPESIQLDGSASGDSDGTIVKYQWTKIAGPASNIILNATRKSTIVSSIVKNRIEVGIYIFELEVTDNDGASSIARVRITVY